MKCPECGFHQKVKDGLTCGSCDYRFTFNPKESATFGLTDGKFSACIKAASQNETAYFTRNQLYAVLCRRMSGSPLAKIGCGIVALTIAAAFYGLTLWPFAIIATLAAILSFMAGFVAATEKVTPTQFNELLDQWLAQGKSIERLIEEPALHSPPPEWPEPDIYDYGVERLLIVERDVLVDLFVKNGLHAEQRMLVISENGYPDYLLPVARRLLAEQADLPVLLLHDATTHGTAMNERVLSDGMLPLQGHPVTDLGMFPADFQRLKRTKAFDRDNTDRGLPVDAMLMPFMTMGLGAAIAGGMTLGAMIEQQQQGTSVDAGIDFG